MDTSSRESFPPRRRPLVRLSAVICSSKVVNGHSDVLRERSIPFAGGCPEVDGEKRPLDRDSVHSGNRVGLTANGSRLMDDECRLPDHGLACLDSGCAVANHGCRRLANGWRFLDNGWRLLKIG